MSSASLFVSLSFGEKTEYGVSGMVVVGLLSLSVFVASIPLLLVHELFGVDVVAYL